MMKRMFGIMANKTKGPYRYWILSACVLVFIIILYCAVIYVEPIRNFVFPEKASNQVFEKDMEESAANSAAASTAASTVDSSADSANTPQSIPERAIDSVKSLFSRPESSVYSELHKMVNSKILADAIWGELEITVERVDSLIQEVSDSDFADKDKLLDMLNNWKNGDFSHAVEEHNYLWEQLDGTVGEAYGLRTRD